MCRSRVPHSRQRRLSHLLIVNKLLSHSLFGAGKGKASCQKCEPEEHKGSKRNEAKRKKKSVEERESRRRQEDYTPYCNDVW
jgi:hypothetical protein